MASGRPNGAVGAAGFVGHGWIEGATIGVGLQVSTTAGMLAALTVAIHHLCEGLALVCYLPAGSRAAPRALVAGSRGARALAGALMGSVVRVPASLVPLALGLFAGLFLFASVSALRYGGKGLLARHRAHEDTSRTRSGWSNAASAISLGKRWATTGAQLAAALGARASTTGPRWRGRTGRHQSPPAPARRPPPPTWARATSPMLNSAPR